MAKKSDIIVKEVAVKTIKHGNVDYICMTDIARMKNAIDPNGVVANWMRNRIRLSSWVYGKLCTTLILTPSNSRGLELRQA